ncbi:unnamed protein product [Auanema sp. JU1783]|nr:unnamed protein product [Auanema sp. JU1783]
MQKKIKLVVVGDSYVGKTSLLFAYTKKEFSQAYASTVFDNWEINVSIEGVKNGLYTVNLFDTAGQEDYDILRHMSYPNTSVFLVCFSLVEPGSLKDCETIWLPEIRKYQGENVPIILVGTKEDLIDSTDSRKVVSLNQAAKVASEHGCFKFLPCSALTHRGLKRVFDEAFLLAIGKPVTEDRNLRCTIL